MRLRELNASHCFPKRSGVQIFCSWLTPAIVVAWRGFSSLHCARMDSLSLSKETYESGLPDCKPGEELTVTIESPTSSVTMTGVVAAGEEGGLSVPLSAEVVEESVEEPVVTPKKKLSPAAEAAKGAKY